MRRKVYLETTVVSYLAARPSRDLLVAGHQEATKEFWPRLATTFETFVSALVCSRGCRQGARRLAAIEPFQMFDVDDDARRLAERIVAGKGIPQQYPEDALHIAVAAINGIDVLVTWNFAHLSNPFTRVRVRQLVQDAGYACPEICSPEELLESES